MRGGSFIGVHVDRASNPDYSAAIVLQFGKDFSGGEFVVKSESRADVTISPSYRSVVVTRSSLAHQVETVTAVERTSLVYFLADHNGANARYEL